MLQRLSFLTLKGISEEYNVLEAVHSKSESVLGQPSHLDYSIVKEDRAMIHKGAQSLPPLFWVVFALG